MEKKKRPNVLLIFPDQQRYDCLGCSGHRLVRTPNIDRLSSEGINFTNAFTPLPSCCPARQCLLSGKWAENHGGYWNYDITLTPRLFDEHTWTEDLKKSGYQMGYIGKWHVHPERNPLEFGFDDYLDWNDYFDWRKKEQLPEVEYDSFKWFGGTDPVETSKSKTHWYADKVIDLMRKYSEAGEPWHIRLDFEEPHLPCTPTKEFLDMYDPDEIEPWGNFADEFKNKPYIQRQQRITWGIDEFTWDDWKKYLQRYLATVSQTDDAIGLVLEELKNLGMEEDTIVIYSSDHGDACGSHGMIDKHYAMYEELVHVPLIVRWPGVVKQGSKCDLFVNNCLDLASTIPAIAGLDVPEDFQGASLLPILRGEVPGYWRKHIVSTYNGQQFGLYTQRMIRNERYKYVWNLTDVDELYDLFEDPSEVDNKIYDPECAGTLADLRLKLLEELKANGDKIINEEFVAVQLSHGKKA